LETINEECRSTNDELHTINDTLRECSLELDDARTFLGSLVNSIHLGLIAVDRETRVVVWNRACEDLWGLRSLETVGTSLTALDIGLPLGDVKTLLGRALVDRDTTGEVTVDAVNRRGRPTRIRLTCQAFASGESINGALLLMQPQPSG
ncbi:MAG TPA: PAS domain-containing protein, partial [Mycobacterium sp.]|nr:PAS domain-containing protein [Mycobacterium sp.]